MAGIGWKLERLLDRDSLGSTLQAYLTGVAVTSAPWLLTTAVLVTLRALARGHVEAEFATVEHVITFVYAVTLVFSAPTTAAMYTETHNCNNVAPGKSCNVSVTFNPGAGPSPQTLNATLLIRTNTTNGSAGQPFGVWAVSLNGQRK